MTKTEMRELAREYGILNLRIKQAEDRKKEIKERLVEAMAALPTEETKTGTIQHILEGVEGFTAKMYSRTQFYANQAKARKLLHPNTWAAIFKPSTFMVIDVRPTADVKRIGVDEFLRRAG